MKGKIRISKSQVTWIPKNIIEAGFKGKVPFIADASTIVLLHPEASLDEIEKSLKIVLEDVKLRKELKKRLKR